MRTSLPPNFSLIVATHFCLIQYTSFLTSGRISLVFDVAALRNSWLAGYNRTIAVPRHRQASEVNNSSEPDAVGCAGVRRDGVSPTS